MRIKITGCNCLQLCFLFFCAIFFSANVTAQLRSGNPILKGWYADPEAAIFGNNYWIYPTYSAKYKEQVFFDAFSSSNLVSWQKHSRILDTGAVTWAYMAMWAPAVIEKDNKYYLFFSANDIQSKARNGMKDDTLGGIGIAVANKPEGPYKDYLGKPLINQFYNGAQPIDQFVFQDKDGQYYIIYGGWGHCNIGKLNNDFTGIIPFDDGTKFKEITPKGYVEGPFLFLRNNKYYFMWSEGGWTGPDYSVAYAIADSPFGPFERVGKILQQDTTVATGAGHHSIMHNKENDQWYIVYHRRPLGETAANNRETCIEELSFDENGFIKPVKITFEGVKEQRLKRKR
ncbi:glycoside hydrolase family 43 protein [Lacibacter sp.]|uniref:glycoside hydrolase family 43 protein n=1 Tax=Lacibacter sp. TaxID=1915409 RepID=UPI002B4B38EF|nr:glycoside hydrolase family 43 protein [Lacibacter sp.]HLP39726.1 glycoside hydrolase family 43 protein [Lacibacter sp.]